MASKVITENDLTNILNEVLPPKPSEYKKLLWTNASPTSSFEPSSVSLDLSSYDEVEITFINYISAGYRYYVPSIRCKVGEQGIVNGVFGGSAVESGVIFAFERVFNVYTDHIAFGNAAGCADNGSHSIRNDMGIPIEIYGIKYERVAPPTTDALEWKLQGTVTGNVNTVTIPSFAQEVSVIIEATGGVVYSGTAIISGLKAIWNIGGYYLTTSDIGLCNLNVSNNNRTFQIRNCRYGAGTYTTTAILSVYYR